MREIHHRVTQSFTEIHCCAIGLNPLVIQSVAKNLLTQAYVYRSFDKLRMTGLAKTLCETLCYSVVKTI